MATKQSDEGQRLITQLFTLDVNTLITKEPSGEKAPSMQVMLENLAERYGDFAEAHEPGPDARAKPFRTASASARRVRERQEDNRHGVVDRVAVNGDLLHAIIVRAGTGIDHKIDAKKLTPEDAATIRKAWELSLDPVDLTTSVTLQGDVITRFTSREGLGPDAATIDFHRNMVESGLSSWRAIMGVVSQFLATLGRFFLG